MINNKDIITIERSGIKLPVSKVNGNRTSNVTEKLLANVFRSW